MKRSEITSFVVIILILVVAVIFVGGLSLAVRHRSERAVPRLADPPAGATGAAAIDPGRVVDLTHSFDENTVYWPTAEGFRWKKDSWGQNEQGYFYAAGSFATSEHGGTHLDAPIHFAEGRWTADEIPVQRLVGRAVVIDIAQACAQDRNYAMQVDDIARFEARFGNIPEGAIVLVHTGWGRFWPDRKLYLGADKPGDTESLSFPGISEEAAEFLALRRRVSGVGIDTASLDHGPSRDFLAHRVLNQHNIYGLENLANIEKLPPTGATLIALPMKIKGGSGAPTRVVAVLP